MHKFYRLYAGVNKASVDIERFPKGERPNFFTDLLHFFYRHHVVITIWVQVERTKIIV